MDYIYIYNTSLISCGVGEIRRAEAEEDRRVGDAHLFWVPAGAVAGGDFALWYSLPLLSLSLSRHLSLSLSSRSSLSDAPQRSGA